MMHQLPARSLWRLGLCVAALALLFGAPAALLAREPEETAPTTIQLTVDKVDSFTSDVDSDNRADPGDVLHYTVTILNTGTEALTNVALNDTLDPLSTLVPGSVNVLPIAQNDAYAAIGNTPLVVGLTGPATPKLSQSGSLFDNDFDFLGDTFTLSTFDASSVQGGTVTVDASGHFTYLPPTGYSGSDSFTYTIQDTHGATATATVAITVSNMVWYVRAGATPGGTGRATEPFDTLAAVDGGSDPDAAAHVIFVHSGTYNPGSALNLEASQTLIGEGVALVVGGHTLHPAGTAPVINSASDGGVILQTDNTLRGLTLTSNSNSQVLQGSSVGTLTVTNTTLNGSGNLLSIDGGTLAATFNALTTTGGTTAVTLANVSGALTSGSTSLTGVSQGVSVSDLVAGTTVDFGPTTITASSGAVALNSNASSATTILRSPNLSVSGGTAVSGTNFGTLWFGGTTNGQIVATNGVALNLTTGTLNSLQLATLSAANSTYGIRLDNIIGSLTAAGGSISGTNTASVRIGAGTVSVTYAGSVANTAGFLFDIQNRPAGAANLTFSGALGGAGTGINITNNLGGIITFSGTSKTLNTSTNTAVTMTGNTGATVAFSNGGLSITTTSGGGIVGATGGTLEVGGSNNTLTSTTGSALALNNVTIGSLGLTFRSITVNGATTGVTLNNTGSNGLTVTGDGATTGSGGSVSNTANGVKLTSANNVNLNWMTFTNAANVDGASNCDNLTNTGCNAALSASNATNITLNRVVTSGNNQYGVNGTNVTNFTLLNSTLTGCGNALNEGCMRFSELKGSNSLSSSTIANSAERNVWINNTGGSSTITLNALILDNTVASATGNQNFLLETSGTATVNLNAGSSFMLRARTVGLQVAANGSSTVNIDANNNTFDHQGNLGRGIEFAINNSANMTFKILGSNIFGNGGSPLLIAGFGSGSIDGVIRNNAINNTGNADGIRINGNDNIQARIEIDDNVVNQPGDGEGIVAFIRNGATGRLDTRITNNQVFLSTSANAFAGIDVRAQNTNTHCSLISGNTINDVPASGFVFSALSQATATFYLQGYAGSVPATWSANSNNPTSPVDVAGTTFSAPPGGTCLSPTLPRPVAEITPEQMTTALQAAQAAPQQLAADMLTARTTTLAAALPVLQPAVVEVVAAGAPSEAPAALPAAPAFQPAAAEALAPDAAAPAALEQPDAGETINLNIGTIQPGIAVEVVFDATVGGPVPAGKEFIANQATVTGDTFGSQVSNDPATPAANDPTLTPLDALPDLVLSKSDGGITTTPGSTLVYTLAYTNAGTQQASGVVLTETIPLNTAFNAGASAPGWSCAATTPGSLCTLTIGNVNAGASASAAFALDVVNPLAAGVTQVSNTATIADDGTGGADPTPANNTASDTTPINAALDMALTKSDGGISSVPGGTVAYTLTYTNTGNQNATGVALTETVPANSTFNPAASTAGWVCTPDNNAGASCTFNVGAVAGAGAGGSAVFGVTVADPFVADPAIITNTAMITAAAADPNLGNNTATDTTPIVVVPDLALTKSDGGSTTTPGSTVAYTLDYVNNGSLTATGVTLTETVPANTVFNNGASTPGWNCTPNNNPGATCTFSAGAISPTAGGSVTFAVDVASPLPAGVDTLTNTASIVDDGANGVDPTPGNNSATDTTPVLATPDLSITKTDGLTSTTPGSTLVYTVTIANQGNQDATGVVVSETVPANTTFNPGLSSPGWVCVPNNNAGSACTITLATLGGGGGSDTFLFAVDVDNPVAPGVSTITNTATVADDGANGVDPTPGNNSATDTDTLNAAPDLALTKSDGGITTTPGSTVAYTLTLTNQGDQGATGVVLTETVPANTTFNPGASTAGWACAPNNNAGATCTFPVGTLLTSRTVVFAVDVAAVMPAGVNLISNTASAADDGANGADPTPGNNTASDTTPVISAPDLTLTKSDGGSTATPGSPVAYTLSYGNVGNQAANGVVLTETVPANTTFNPGASTAGWACTPNNNAGATCTLALGALGVGASSSATFAVTVISPVPAGVDVITNTATIADDATGGSDPNPGNNSATDTTPVTATPDLSLVKNDDGVTTTPGSTVVYTLEFANTGNQGATGVVLTETVPANTTFNPGASTAGWACTPNNNAGATCSFNYGALDGGAFDNVAFAVDVVNMIPAGVTQLSNTASIADDGANGADPTPGDNTGSDTTPVTAAPDLSVTKTDGGISTIPGATVVYTITLSNVGDQAATGVVLTETVPANTIYNGGFSTPQWSCVNGAPAGSTCTLNVGALSTPRTFVFAVDVVTPVPAGVNLITNTVSAVDDGTNGADPNPGNNSGTDTTPINATVDVAISKWADRSLVMNGDPLVYTLAYTITGDAIIDGLRITDTLPAAFAFGSVAQSGLPLTQLNGPPTLVWGADGVLPGSTGMITLTGSVTVPANSEITITNTAQIAHPLDSTPANNQAQAVVASNVAPTASAGGPYTVNEGSPLTVSAAASSDPGNDIVSYAWDLDNDGQYDDASGVTATFTNTLDDSVWTIGVQVTDADNASSTASTTVTVLNVDPSVNAGPDRVTRPAVPLQFTGTFTDPGVLDTHTINWDFGDGGTATGVLTPSHAYVTPGIYTATLTVEDDDGGIGSDELVVTVGRAQLFIPFVSKAAYPDLVVSSVTPSANNITVVLRNQGSAPVTSAFWVDLYVNPRTAPTGVNQTWPLLGTYGAAWNIPAADLPILPGATLTLTLNDSRYRPAESNLPATIAAGSQLYVQVDSANVGSTYGAIFEDHEVANQPYNNISGPLVTSAPITPPAPRPAQTPSDAVLPRRQR